MPFPWDLWLSARKKVSLQADVLGLLGYVSSVSSVWLPGLGWEAEWVRKALVWIWCHKKGSSRDLWEVTWHISLDPIREKSQENLSHPK
jgi:hypothetical protein